MWVCPKCKRIFKKEKQPHSCRKVLLEKHFENKLTAKKLFDNLFEQILKKVGKSKIISIPCCIHLFGSYDYLAILPKKDGLEIRFVLDRQIDSVRLKQSVPVSAKYIKNCIEIKKITDIDSELIDWLKEAYSPKNRS